MADSVERPVGKDVPAYLVDALPVTTDLACVRCGRNLRGLRRDEACPRCGCVVRDSYLGDRLDLAAPGWVRGLALGARLAEAGFGAAIVAVVLSVFVDARWPGYLLWAGIGLFGAGTWLLTRREPREGVAALPTTVAARVGAGVAVLAAVVLMVWSHLLLATAALLVLGGASVVLGLHLMKLAKRVPNDSLAAMLNNIGWGAGVVFAVYSVLIWGAQTLSEAGMVVLCVLPPLLLFVVTFGAWVLGLEMLGRELGRCGRGGR